MAEAEYIPHYSIQDYQRWDGDWELWNGIPVAMSPSPNFRHQRISLRIAAEMERQLALEPCLNGCLTVQEIDWQVDESTVVRPDVVILCEEPEGDFVETAPALIVEVLSPSTRTKDLTSKRDLYASRGVKFYLIFDPENESAQFLTLDEGTYREIPTESELILNDNCIIHLNVNEIF